MSIRPPIQLEKKTKELLEKAENIQTEIEETKNRRNRLRMDLEALKADIQRKFIEQNTARLNVETAKERMEEAEAGRACVGESVGARAPGLAY